MKRIILILVVLFIGIGSYSQTSTNIPEQDTSLLFIEDSLNSVGEDLVEIGEVIKEDYNELGFVGFVRIYKYYIIIVLVFVVLTLLWFRNRGEEKE